MNLKSLLNDEKIPQYYINALEYLLTRVDIKGKKILEVGGSTLPYFLTNEILKVDQWVCIDFIDWGGGYQQNFSKENYKYKRHFYKETEFDNVDWTLNNIVIDGDANDILPKLSNSFDIVISVNCFEHVENLTLLINNIYRSLKDGGVLYSNFGPIWSCSVGHHLSLNKKLHFNSVESILTEHEHLLLNPLEMKKYLENNGIEEDDIKWAIYRIYEAKQINRLTYNDYKKIFLKTLFTKKEIWSSHKKKTKDNTLTKLNKIKIDDYTTYCIGLYFIK